MTRHFLSKDRRRHFDDFAGHDESLTESESLSSDSPHRNDTDDELATELGLGR